MDLFHASVRSALRNDFADHVDLLADVRERPRRREDGLSDVLRLVFGRPHHETRGHGPQWPTLTPPL